MPTEPELATRPSKSWRPRIGRPRLRTAIGLAAAVAAIAGWANRDAGAYLLSSVLAAGGVASGHEDSFDLIAEGQRVFRFETFGDEQFWTDTLHLNEVVQTAVSPATALRLGLKVDAGVLPPGLLQRVDLQSPATTVALLKLNAIVGVQATVDANNRITRLGITCALCHSTVDNSTMRGVGLRKDGWPNRDVNIGAIIALSRAVAADKAVVYNSWGRGMYDPRFNVDGKSTPLPVPPIYGLADVKQSTSTADGTMAYWNAYVAVTQMHGHGSFADPRLGIRIRQTPDMVRPRLAALRAYQRSLVAPPPPPGSFDPGMADGGRVVFDGNCASCHVGGTGTDNDRGLLHSPIETGMSGAYAIRTANRAYRTTPLRALWQHPPYFHDGSGSTLPVVVAHYNHFLQLELTAQQQRDLVEYLKSL